MKLNKINKWLKVGLAVGLLGGCAVGLAVGQTVFTNPAPALPISVNGIPVAMTAQDLFVSAGGSQLQDESKAVSPLYASGGCTTTPVIAGSPWAFTLTNGASGCSGNTIVLTLPAAGNNGKWVCDAYDITSPTTTYLSQSAAASTTSVTFTNYTRSTGAVLTWVASDVILAKCFS